MLFCLDLYRDGPPIVRRCDRRNALRLHNNGAILKFRYVNGIFDDLLHIDTRVGHDGTYDNDSIINYFCSEK